MLFYYLLAILAAFCWSLASLISADISRSLGGIGFNRIRLIIVSVMLITYASIDNTWSSINIEFLITSYDNFAEISNETARSKQIEKYFHKTINQILFHQNTAGLNLDLNKVEIPNGIPIKSN